MANLVFSCNSNSDSEHLGRQSFPLVAKLVFFYSSNSDSELLGESPPLVAKLVFSYNSNSDSEVTSIAAVVESFFLSVTLLYTC